MIVRWRHVLIFLVGLPAAVLFIAWIGFFNVGASTGHWRVTEWFLEFAMRAAIRTYAIGIEVPDIGDPALLPPAAGHFRRSCAMCHGAPGEPRSPTVMEMLPQPPDLALSAPEWSDAELFRIVRHGIRFTGMPAWPSQAREDEVWAMVAFLRALPAMEEERWRGLAYGEASDSQVAACAGCHGADGSRSGGLVPRIGGQSEAYLAESLRAFAEGRRESGMMAVVAAGLTEAQRAALARHFASQPAAARGSGGAAGGDIARHGIPERNVPACLGCHGGEPRNPLYPRLDGQDAAYLANQLRLFRAGTRGGTAYHHLMTRAAAGLSDAEIDALASWFAAR